MDSLLIALGCATEDEGIALVNQLNTFIADARVATGTTDRAAALVAIQSNAAAVRSLDNLTGKSGGESLALVTAWKSGAADADRLRAEIAEIKKTGEDSKASAAIDKAVADGRLEPSKRGDFDALYRDYGSKALTAALNALPAGRAPSDAPAPSQPAAPSAGAKTGPATDSEKQVMRATGKTLAEIREAVADWDRDETDTPGGRGVFFKTKAA